MPAISELTVGSDSIPSAAWKPEPSSAVHLGAEAGRAQRRHEVLGDETILVEVHARVAHRRVGLVLGRDRRDRNALAGVRADEPHEVVGVRLEAL